MLINIAHGFTKIIRFKVLKYIGWRFGIKPIPLFGRITERDFID